MENVCNENEEKSFKKTVKKLASRWFIDAFSGMAQGLFCTLIAGTILAMIAKWIGNNYVGKTLLVISDFAKTLMGAGIGVGIANALKREKLVMFSAAVAGFVGAFSDMIITLDIKDLNKWFSFGKCGNPIGAYVVALIAVEVVSLYAGKTKLDILIVPLGTLVLCLGGIYVAYPFIFLITKLGALISRATEITPFFMGIIISVVMGVLLTMPTSSAAIWLSVASGITDDAMLIAGGAAVVGCSCHMIGFAVASFRENGVSGLVSQGIGTSMLQIPNIMKNPAIMLPEIISSAILGPVSTCLFGLKCNASGGGMGTSGLVGVFGTIEASVGMNPWILALGIALLLFILPAALSFGFSELFRKIGWIKFGDQKLD